VSTQPPQPTEEELRAYQAQLEQVRVEDVLVQTLVSLVNLGGVKAGVGQLDQLRTAIEGARALLPLVETELGPDAAQVRNALSQLQMAYAQGSGASEQPGQEQPAAPAEPQPGEPPQPEGPGPAQSSGRLWVPGQ
jgi:hypothetical protein